MTVPDGAWHRGLPVMLALGVVMVACGGPDRPAEDHIVVPDVVGVVARVGRPNSEAVPVLLEDGTLVAIPRSATVLYGPSYGVGRLLLYGEDFDRVWYTGLPLDPLDLHSADCYHLFGFAFDEPDAVVVAFTTWEGFGVRLPKQPGLDMSDYLFGGDRYNMTGESVEASFCLDTTGTITGPF